MTGQLECRNHSTGRRYPMVIGRIKDVVLPWPITLPQLGAGLVGMILMLTTRPVWRALLGDGPVVGLTVVLLSIVVPIVVARPMRIEGRSMPAAAIGRLRRLLWPRHGMHAGRPVRSPRRHRRRCDTRIRFTTPQTSPAELVEVEPQPQPAAVWSSL